ncbi:ribosome small subunit-dependent GTPase A [Marivita geojedonensis]|uniref:Small ribosomal subunit biogenesis GTPase RsgA n=1 Tax=Marivita geojedonensis TaxID=1123756 RepID=A0A1X4NNN9_9RHOB|nr:ribosome small subunit-dependent GTPase A [Marivita geojedonensis]OSQ52005.1 GTPase RsgA [Marivita geojedonensis]PRY81245.1 ribosome biogenesis GTPase [Marivita geojedonensis]
MTTYTLTDLGWSDHFARQLSEDDAALTPARISEVHRSQLIALSEAGDLRLIPTDSAGAYAVGDWVLTDGTSALRRLDPVTDLHRRAAGHAVGAQRIAANVDTVGLVTSCNADFNVARLERYLALALASNALPLVILTKADLCDDPDSYKRKAERMSPLVTAITVNAKDPEDVKRLTPWCRNAQTLALLGSSGVGKTTLRNALTGETEATQGIREDDAKGRHTTTHRALRPTLAGGWLIDTPGMRELQLSGTSGGLEELFDDIETLAAECKFSNCAHDTEPGCAVKAALENGSLEQARFDRWQKLRREDQYNSETIAAARARQKSFGRVVKEAMSTKSRYKRGYED